MGIIRVNVFINVAIVNYRYLISLMGNDSCELDRVA